MIRVPLAASPIQTLSVVLANQVCEITLRQNGGNMYFDLRADGVDIVTSRIVRNKQLLLLNAKYRKFRGDFIFIDSQGDEQPTYTQLGSRFVLYYVSPSDIAT